MNDSLISLADSQLKVAAEPTPYVRSFLQVDAFKYQSLIIINIIQIVRLIL